MSSVFSCGTTPRRARIAGPFRTGSMPRIVSVPLVGGDTQPTMRMVEDLPAPLGPRKPNASPRGILKSMPSTAVKFPNRLVRPLAFTRTSAAAAGSAGDTLATLPRGRDNLTTRFPAPMCITEAGQVISANVPVRV